jgi:hypothetical protein
MNRTEKTGLLRCGAQIADDLGVSTTYMSALRHAMGLHGKTRYMELDVVRRWLRNHPEFKVQDVYPRGRQSRQNRTDGANT